MAWNIVYAGNAPGNTIIQPTAGQLSVTGIAPTVTGSIFTENFSFANENPLSHGGIWVNNGLDWTPIRTTSGLAYGTQVSSEYDDSYEFISSSYRAFSANQCVGAVIYKEVGYTGSGGTHEVEVLLRCTDAAHAIHWYECNLHVTGAYAQIVKLDGARGVFTDITGPGAGAVNPRTGDIIEADIIGNAITFRHIRGATVTTMATATDSSFATGQPGIAFFTRPLDGAVNNKYGFTSMYAYNLP